MEWTPIKKQYPPFNTRVEVKGNNFIGEMDFLSAKENEVKWGSGELTVVDASRVVLDEEGITHWKSLPVEKSSIRYDWNNQ